MRPRSNLCLKIKPYNCRCHLPVGFPQSQCILLQNVSRKHIVVICYFCNFPPLGLHKIKVTRQGKYLIIRLFSAMHFGRIVNTSIALILTSKCVTDLLQNI